MEDFNVDPCGIPLPKEPSHHLGIPEEEKRYWFIPVFTAVAGVVASSNQKSAAKEARKAQEAAAKAKQKEMEMQLAALREQTEAQQEMLKQVAIYGGAAVGGIMLIRGITR